MTEAMMPLMEIQNSGMTVQDGSDVRRKTKILQNVNPTMASANSNHRPAAILHTTRSTIKDNLAVKVSKLANRHQTHGEARNMGNQRDRKNAGGEVTNGGNR